MMSLLKRLYGWEITAPQPNSASCEKLLPYQSNEKAVFSIDHIGTAGPVSKREQRKWPSLIKVLSLIIAATLTLAYSRSSRRSIHQYAVNKYTAFLAHSNVESHVDCTHDETLETLSFITAEPQNAHRISHEGWEAACSTFDGTKHDCRYAIEQTRDDKFWQSKEVRNGAAHWFAIDLKQKQHVHSVEIRAPKDESWTKGYIQNHLLEVAAEKDQWETVALGAWRAWKESNFATFEPRWIQYIRLNISDAWDNANVVGIGNVDVWATSQRSLPAVARGGKWGITLNFPSVPVTAFLDPKNQKLITMASKEPDRFWGDSQPNQTVSATWDPESGKIRQEIVSITEHDLFCPGTSLDQDGRAIFTGGSSPDKFTIYSPDSQTWFTPKDLTTQKPITINMSRGYQGQTFLPNGKTFMIGGTWSGGGDDKHGEIYDPATRKWSLLPGIPASYIKMDNVTIPDCDPHNKTNKQDCVVDAWRQHHAWLFAWKNSSIFHAGPSKQMNWFFPGSAPGERKDAGKRADHNQTFADTDAVSGVTAMYDAEAGTILTAGGAPNYHYWRKVDNKTNYPEHRNESTRNAFEINIGNVYVGTKVKPKKLEDMHHQRIFANAVILPTGETLVVGGQIQGEPFYDETWQSTPEIYDPMTGHWREVAPHSTPRVYHSWALLRPDASVLVGGSGLSRPESDHYDAQIYYPPYLFNPDDKTLARRPKIEGVDKQDKVYKAGETIVVTVGFDFDAATTTASLLRYSAATHALNNDIRRIKLTPKPVSGMARKFEVVIPRDTGVTLPGYWMLFVLVKGVPSHAQTIKILGS